MRHIIPISGKDSLATAITQIKRVPDLPYEFMFNPTGAETPEVEEWLQRVEASLGITIQRVGENLEEIIYDQGILPSARTRYCTRLAKIYPMEDWIGGDDAVVYYGIRADEKRVGYVQTGKKQNITPCYPLQEEGLGLGDVWQIVQDADLVPPDFFWQGLYDDTKRLLGENAGMLDDLDETMKRSLFAWRTRANCFFCFFQRKYEWAGLAEMHPELYERAATMEKEIGAEGYNWRSDGSLATLKSNAPAIRLKRAKQIVVYLYKRAQMTISFDELVPDDEPADLLNVVSCGLFCGK